MPSRHFLEDDAAVDGADDAIVAVGEALQSAERHIIEPEQPFDIPVRDRKGLGRGQPVE